MYEIEITFAHSADALEAREPGMPLVCGALGGVLAGGSAASGAFRDALLVAFGFGVGGAPASRRDGRFRGSWRCCSRLRTEHALVMFAHQKRTQWSENLELQISNENRCPLS